MGEKSKSVLIHVGQPKAWSTSIQRCLQSVNAINYLGYLPSFPNRSWYANDIGKVFEFGIRLESMKSFEKNLSAYAECVNLALSEDLLNVISCEALAFKCFPGEHDTREKLERLRRVIRDAEVHFLYIWRSPEFILRSLYREFIRLGISQNFETFLEDTYRLRHHNFSDDLCGKSLVEELEKIFGSAPIYSFSISENAEFDAEQIQRLLIRALRTPVPRASHHNRSLDDAVLSVLLDLNRTAPRLLSFDNLIEHHRLFPEIAVNDDSWVWKNAQSRRAAVDRATQIAAGLNQPVNSFMHGENVDEYIRSISEGKFPPPQRIRL